MRLADCRSLEEARSRFDRLDLGSYPPFTIVLLAPKEPSMLLHWMGHQSLIEDNGESAMPLISSSSSPGALKSIGSGSFKRWWRRGDVWMRICSWISIRAMRRSRAPTRLVCIATTPTP